MTRKQKLRHKQPLWLAAPRIRVATKDRASAGSYDILIVGAGIPAP
jgi:hypothetical protein